MKRPRIPSPAQPRGGSPVARALALQTMDNELRLACIHIYNQQEGEDSAELLANLAWVIGVGAEASYRVSPTAPDTRRLHGALRTVVQMAAAGCRWQSIHAHALHAAAQDSKALMVRHRDIADLMTEGANFLAHHVRHGTATMDLVAGAEIYITTPTGAAA